MTAAAQRKLQKDIEVVLKKVDDGIDEFAHVWDQATTSSNSSQKEKLGEELKKSINKLQRLRVQIREWIGQTEVKVQLKDKLEEARKRIEGDMQRFKEFERELKTKAFSVYALAKVTDELDLEEVEKRKYQEWLVTNIQTLSEQVEEYEADLEVLQNKKSLSGDDKDRSAFLQTTKDRHCWHMKKLEMVLRALDNDALDVSDLAIVRDTVEVYIDMHQDPDYPHDEALYDCFDLHEYEAVEKVEPRTPSNMDSAAKDGGTPKEEPQKKAKEKEKRKKDEKKEKKKEDKKAATPQNAATGASSRKPSDGKSTPVSGDVKDKREEIIEEECKVQADQLLLGGEAEEFVCKICQTHVVGCGPTLTNCSHLFCGDCLGQWFAQHPESQTWAQRAKAAGPDRVVPCPVCKQPLNEKRDLYPVCGATSRSENLLLWRMLSSLKIMCINHNRMSPGGKCEWIGEYGQYQKHIKQCESEHNASGAPGSGAVFVPVASLTPAPAAIREPSEPRRVESETVSTAEVAEKSPAHGSTASDRSPHVAKLPPASKPVVEHSPKASSTPTAQQSPVVRNASSVAVKASSDEREVREQQRHESHKVSAPVLPVAQELKSSSVGTGYFLPMAEESLESASSPVTHSDTASQQVLQQPKVQQSQPAAASSPQHASQHNTSSQPSPQQSQARKPAPQPQQEADGSYITQATSAFDPTGPNMVPAQIGDTIHVLERHGSGWTYCKNLSLPGSAANSTGWAPSWIVAAEDSSNSRKPARPKEHEASITSPSIAQHQQSSPSPSVASAKVQESVSVAQAELHRSPQPAVTSAPTPQHSTQAAATAVPPAPKAPSTVVRVATAGFSGSSNSQLTVNTGDLVEIVESHASGWTYGRKVHSAHNSAHSGAIEGWFPDWVCAQK